MASPEQAPSTAENLEASKAAAERREELDNKLEAGAELGVENIENAAKQAEKAKAEAIESAEKAEKSTAEKAKKSPEATPRRRGAISKKEREASFKKEMQRVQAEMSAPQRAFSKLIHNKAVEKVSDVVGSTVARPNAIFAGALTAFVLVLAVYLISKNFGYVLSGFETIGAFIVGWILGVLYDYLRVVITGKK